MKTSERIGLLIFLQSRNELTREEENELREWRKESSSNESFFQQLTDGENTRAMMTDLYRSRDRVFDKLKIQFPYLADVNLSGLEYAAELQDPGAAEADSGTSRAAYWGSMLPELSDSVYDSSESEPEELTHVGGIIRRMRKNRAFRWVSNIAAVLVGLLIVLTVAVQFLPGSRPHKYTGHISAQFVTADGITHIINDLTSGYNIGRADFDIGTDSEGYLVYEAHDHTREPLDKFITMNTPRAGEFPFRFPDQTYMWINSESRLDFPAHFSTDTIKMRFTGETYMEVPAHSKTVMQVKLPGGLLESSGAHMNIKAYPDEPFSTVTLITGSAVYRISSGDGLPASPFILHAGEQIRIAGDQVTIVPNAVIEDAIAWRKEKISFHNEDLPVIMRLFERLYDKKVEYSVPVPDKKFTIQLPRDIPFTEFLSALQLQGLNFQEVEGKIRLVK